MHERSPEERTQVYKGGLMLEQEEIEETEERYRHKFAGIIMDIRKDFENFQCRTLNKNEEMLKEKGKQRYGRYPPERSNIPYSRKMATQIGNLVRFSRENTNKQMLMKTLKYNMVEMKSIGYSDEFLQRAVNRLKDRSYRRVVKDIMNIIMKKGES